MTRTRRQTGFTLLELLIAMTLLGFILALLFSGFRLASRSWDAVDARLERTTQEEMARAVARRLLIQMQPIRWKKALDQPIAFVGEPNRIVFIAPLSGQAGVSGLRVIEIGASGGNQGSERSATLVLKQGPLRRDAENFVDTLTGTKEHLLLDDLSAVQFDFFGPAKKDDPPQWQTTWVNPTELPRLVRIRLGSADPGWSDLVISPAITGGACNWDALFKRCR
jgi:general secretion pathway protein J